jgi:hypothetical protein
MRRARRRVLMNNSSINKDVVNTTNSALFARLIYLVFKRMKILLSS